MRIGYPHPDRLISYPDPHNLSIWRQPIRMRSRRRHRWTILEGNALGRAWLRCPWAAAGPGRASSQHTEPCISTAGAAGVEGAGGSGGHGRASRSTTPSEARVWRSRGRPGPTAPGTPAEPQATSSTANSGCAAGVEAAAGPAGPGRASRRRITTQHRRRRRCGGRRRVRRARAGFEIDHSERSSRVAISRAAGPDGARNTIGAASTAGDQARLQAPLEIRTPRSTPGSGRPGGHRGGQAH